jgi:hypothetical protein
VTLRWTGDLASAFPWSVVQSVPKSDACGADGPVVRTDVGMVVEDAPNRTAGP